MIAWFALGCAPRLYYEPVLYPTASPPVGMAPGDALAREIADGLVVRNAGVPVDPLAIPPAVAWVVWLHAGRGARGGEFDVTHGGWRVEIVRTTTGETDVRWAVATVSPPTTSGVIPLRLVDGTASWTLAEEAAVATAAALLGPELLPWVDDVELWRDRVSPRQPRLELSWYESQALPARIQLFDAAFEDERFGFAGAPDAPVGIAATTVLHELAHALADAPIRQAYANYLEVFALGGDSRTAWRRYHQLRKLDPVITAFARVWTRRGPTPYAGRNVHEAFAESFYLFYADPAALERVAPEVAAWLRSGGALAAALGPPPPRH